MVLTANNNTRLSRRLLWAIIFLYLLPGLLARSPWKPDDAIGFGQAYSFVQRDFSSWSYGLIGDRLYAEGGLPSAWLAGSLGKAAKAINLPERWVDDVMRLGNIFWLILAGWAIWNATYRLARRSELQPEDPFGNAPARIDYARAVADASVLCLLGTLGLLIRAHYQTPDVAGLAGISLILLAAIRSLDRPIGAGWMLGWGIVVSLLSKGWSHTLPFVAILLMSSCSHNSLRFGLLRRLMRAFLVAGTVLGLWFFWLMSSSTGQQWWDQWMNFNFNQYLLFNPQKNLDKPLFVTTLKTVSWFLWPVLPLAAWTVWQYRKAFREPALRLPFAAAAAGLVVLLITNPAEESNYFPMLAPLTVLAALGLSTMRRSLVSLLDWFAVLWFTFAAVLVWLGWTASLFGYPAKLARNFEKLSPGYVPEVIGLELILAILASLAWLALIRWRTASLTKAVWRPMVLSGGGVVLIWMLMMTLWLPRIEYAKSFTPIGQIVTAESQKHLENHGNRLGKQTLDYCVLDYNLGFAQRAAIEYPAELSFYREQAGRPSRRCQFLLIQDDRKSNQAQLHFESQVKGEWLAIWRGGRKSDRREMFVLYARQVPHSDTDLPLSDSEPKINN